jgi:outer membrane protein assembly factor BamB
MRELGGSRRARLSPGPLKAIVFGLVAAAATMSSALASSERPTIIPLPKGFQPEGITTTQEGNTFFTGSLANGAIFKGNLKTGEGDILAPGAEGRVAAGLKVRAGRVWAAGGSTGEAYVFDAHSGEELATFTLTTDPTFINDVAVTHRAAWFTDSFNQRLYQVPIEGTEFGRPKALPLSGDISFVAGEFNVNGIDSAGRGGKLIVVQSNTGQLFSVDRRTGEATVIDLGGESVPGGDGILLDGRTLWVVQNFLNVVTAVELDPDLMSGEVVSRTTHRSFDVPTTVAVSDGFLALPNARFGTAEDPTTARYWITQIPKPTEND